MRDQSTENIGGWNIPPTCHRVLVPEMDDSIQAFIAVAANQHRLTSKEEQRLVNKLLDVRTYSSNYGPDELNEAYLGRLEIISHLAYRYVDRLPAQIIDADELLGSVVQEQRHTENVETEFEGSDKGSEPGLSEEKDEDLDMVYDEEAEIFELDWWLSESTTTLDTSTHTPLLIPYLSVKDVWRAHIGRCCKCMFKLAIDSHLPYYLESTYIDDV